MKQTSSIIGDMNGIGGIIAFLVAWLVSHVLKVIVTWAKKGRMSAGEALGIAFRSGGMPSGHTADMVALSTYMGLWGGFDSAVFALAICVTVIVIYDAMNVRYAVGEMGKELNRVAGKKMRVYEGHTIWEVVVGAILGVVVGLSVFLLTG